MITVTQECQASCSKMKKLIWKTNPAQWRFYPGTPREVWTGLDPEKQKQILSVPFNLSTHPGAIIHHPTSLEADRLFQHESSCGHIGTGSLEIRLHISIDKKRRQTGLKPEREINPASIFLHSQTIHDRLKVLICKPDSDP